MELRPGISDFDVLLKEMEKIGIDRSVANVRLLNETVAAWEMWHDGALHVIIVITQSQGFTQLHGLNLTNQYLRAKIYLLWDLVSRYSTLYSCHKVTDPKVGKLLRMVGFMVLWRDYDNIFYRREKRTLPV